MAFGPGAGLEIVDDLNSDSQLSAYHLLPSVRGDLLEKLGRFEERAPKFTRAAARWRRTRAKGRCFWGAPLLAAPPNNSHGANSPKNAA